MCFVTPFVRLSPFLYFWLLIFTRCLSLAAQAEVSTDIKIDLEEFEELWVEKAEKVAAKKKVRAAAPRARVEGCHAAPRRAAPRAGLKQTPISCARHVRYAGLFYTTTAVR